MSSRSNFKNISFWGIIILLLFTVHINTAIFLGRLNLELPFLSTSFSHFLSIIGASFVSVFTPIYYILKRRKIKLFKPLLSVHMFGNVISFFMVSTHVFTRLIRIPFGVGFLLFILLIVLVISGFIFRFNLLKPLRIYVKDTPHYNRYFHVSLTLSFYLIFIFHLINAIAFR